MFSPLLLIEFAFQRHADLLRAAEQERTARRGSAVRRARRLRLPGVPAFGLASRAPGREA
jgi:outer membrane protein TolC